MVELQHNLPAKFVWILVLPLALALVLCLTKSALAHRPLFASPGNAKPDSALRISDPSVSHVIYAELSTDAPYRWFVFENGKPREIKFQIGVPSGSVRVPSEPTVVLFGPGLPHPPPSLPMEPPQGETLGGIVISQTDTPQTFDEPVTGTQSLILVETSVTLPAPGTFYGVVFDDSGGEGKLWIGVGQSEGFGWRDVLRLPGWIRDVRHFHQVPGWPRWVWIFVVVLSTVVAVLLVWVIRKMRRV